MLVFSGSGLTEDDAEPAHEVFHIGFGGLGGKVVYHTEAFHGVVKGLFTHAAHRGRIGHGILHEYADHSLLHGGGVNFTVPCFSAEEVEQREGGFLFLEAVERFGHSGNHAESGAVLFEHALHAFPEGRARSDDEDIHREFPCGLQLGLVMTAAAGVFKSEGLEATFDEGLHSRAHSGEHAGEEHFHAHLLEAHEGAHTHAASEEHLDAGIGEILHRSHAAAVMMGNGVESADFLHSAVFDFDEGVDVAMAEMHAHVGVEAAGQAGGNSNDHFLFSGSGRCSGFAARLDSLKGRPHVLQGVTYGIIEFGQCLSPYHGLSDHGIEGQATQQSMTVFSTHGRYGIGLGGIEIRLVDDDGERYAEMAAEVGHAGEVVAARGGGFHHAHGQRSAGKRGDDGASYAGRAVAEYRFQFLFAGTFPGFSLEQAHQLAGIFLSGEELGMHHLTEAGVAHIPVAAMAFREVYGLSRAELHAHAAAFTAQRVDLVDGSVKGDGLEGAELLALAAVNAVGLPYLGLVARDEGLCLLNVRGEQDVQIRGIYVEVAYDLVLGEVGEGRAHGGLAGTSLAADNDYLTHGQPPSGGRIRRAGHRAGR